MRQFADPVRMWPGGPLYGAGLFIGPQGQFAHPGDWLGFLSNWQVSVDRTRSMAVLCNSWDIRMNDIAGPLSEIWLAPAG